MHVIEDEVARVRRLVASTLSSKELDLYTVNARLDGMQRDVSEDEGLISSIQERKDALSHTLHMLQTRLRLAGGDIEEILLPGLSLPACESRFDGFL